MVDLPNFSLKNRVILLTGASGHLGQAISAAIIDADGILIASGRRVEVLEAMKNSLPNLKRDNCYIISGDITKEETIESINKFIKEKFGVLHGIVNNASSGRVGSISDIGIEDFLISNQINLITPFLLTKKLLPLLENGKWQSGIFSSVVNIASMYGIVSPDPSIYADSGKNNPIQYGAAKAGLIQMTRYFACNLCLSGIRFNCISPGPFPNKEKKANDIPNFFENLAKKVPMNRVGEPHEISGPVIFLLSDAASYVNGVNLSVDGGWTVW